MAEIHRSFCSSNCCWTSSAEGKCKATRTAYKIGLFVAAIFFISVSIGALLWNPSYANPHLAQYLGGRQITLIGLSGLLGVGCLVLFVWMVTDKTFFEDTPRTSAAGASELSTPKAWNFTTAFDEDFEEGNFWGRSFADGKKIVMGYGESLPNVLEDLGYNDDVQLLDAPENVKQIVKSKAGEGVMFFTFDSKTDMLCIHNAAITATGEETGVLILGLMNESTFEMTFPRADRIHTILIQKDGKTWITLSRQD